MINVFSSTPFDVTRLSDSRYMYTQTICKIQKGVSESEKKKILILFAGKEISVCNMF